MKFSVCGALAVASLAAGVEAAAPTVAELSLFTGVKALDHDDWRLVDAQSEGGVSATFEPSSWLFGATAAYYLSYGRGHDYYDNEEEFRARTHELEFGPSKTWVIGNWGRPYAAGGVAIGKVTASLESASVTDSDSGVGGLDRRRLYVRSRTPPRSRSEQPLLLRPGTHRRRAHQRRRRPLRRDDQLRVVNEATMLFSWRRRMATG